jgi:hypothetical protein
MLEKINQEIKEAALTDTNGFLYKFLEREDEIVDDLQAYNGLQTEFYIRQKPKEVDQVKFASIFSDFISLYSGGLYGSESHLTFFSEGSPYNYNRQVTIPANLTSEISLAYQMRPCYSHSNTEDVRKAAKRFEPLLDSTKAMLRPIRSLWVEKDDAKSKTKGVIYYAHGNTSTKHWIVKDSFPKDSLPIENYLNSPQSEILFDLTIPYFRNTTLENLTKVLIDESDSLGVFRKELKKVIIDFDHLVMNLKEIQQDILRPQIETINKNFKHYKSIHSLGVLGSVGLFSLSLIKVVVPELLISEFVNSIIGGSGLSGLFLSELKYQSNMNTLRDNPYFLLWRIHNPK